MFRRLAVAAMLLAFFAGAGYTLTLDLQEPQQQHPIAFHVVPLPDASGAEPAPGFYQRPPFAPVNPMPPPPGYFTDGLA